MARTWTLIGADGELFAAAHPGTLGGHRRTRVYGRLDCPSALRAIARGGYVRDRVFFASKTDAVAAGYRPCAVCMPGDHARWKAARRAPDASSSPTGRWLQRSASRCTRSTTTSSRSP